MTLHLKEHIASRWSPCFFYEENPYGYLFKAVG